jgi:Putative peptidoglycan binding domain/Penicillin-insensitive murein endopeptidase
MQLVTAGSRSNNSISASVGRRGVNRETDVRTVQKLLNVVGAGIKEDGDCGRATVNAIEDYQRNWTRNPDGRIDPTGQTWKRLLEGRPRVKRDGYVILPQVCGSGYYSYSSSGSQFGTPATVQALVRVCRKFAKKYPNLEVGIGDMSFADGAKMPPHKTHRNGRNADIRPLRIDARRTWTAISEPTYSREHTKGLVELLRADPNVTSILFNDSAIAGVTYWKGHDNHLHVSMKE